MSFVNTVDLVGDETLAGKIIDKTIVEIADNITKRIGENAFYDCPILTSADFRVATEVNGHAFYRCSNLSTIDFSVLTTINKNPFYSCSALRELILRSGIVCSLGATLNSSAISSGKCYIYVPAALVDNYKAATNWSTYANQFRALEDYTVDGTTTGELDPNKI